MLIKTGYSNIFHGCDYLCFNLLTHTLSLKITLGNIPLVGIIEHSVDILITETQFYSKSIALIGIGEFVWSETVGWAWDEADSKIYW